MKGVSISDIGDVNIAIKNCEYQDDEIQIEVVKNGKWLMIVHSDFTTHIRIKRLEYGIALAKAIWLARHVEEIRNSFATIWKRETGRVVRDAD